VAATLKRHLPSIGAIYANVHGRERYQRPAENQGCEQPLAFHAHLSGPDHGIGMTSKQVAGRAGKKRRHEVVAIASHVASIRPGGGRNRADKPIVARIPEAKRNEITKARLVEMRP